MNPLLDLVTMFMLYVFFAQERPDCVLCYGIKSIALGSIPARMGGCRQIASVVKGVGYVFMGGSNKSRLIARLVSWEIWFALRFHRVVFFQNRDDMRMFLSKGLVAGKQVQLVNGSGVNTREFQPISGSDSSSSNGELRFVMVARMLRSKGVREYVTAARIVHNRNSRARFLLVGPSDTNPESISARQLAEWHSSGPVEYVGEVSDVRPIVGASSVFVLPSYREGTPRAVLEAMAMGKPVVTTDVPGCRETVLDGVNGFIVPVRDSLSLAHALARFLDTPELVKSMGGQSREIAVSKYDVRRVNLDMIEVLGL